MYCREEKESEKSFHRLVNEELRTKDPNKIDRLIVLLGLINKLIENKELASFKGKVYRATKLDENLILQLKEGSKMITISCIFLEYFKNSNKKWNIQEHHRGINFILNFWSTSKKFSVAEKLMRKDKWRNAYIICDTIRTNIDIDYEKLNPYNEYEVLFLPFTEFKIEKIYSEDKYGRKIYIIELIELGNKNFVSFDNMNKEFINLWAFCKNIKKVLAKKFKIE